jgi:hypothetical protein
LKAEGILAFGDGKKEAKTVNAGNIKTGHEGFGLGQCVGYPKQRQFALIAKDMGVSAPLLGHS